MTDLEIIKGIFDKRGVGYAAYLGHKYDRAQTLEIHCSDEGFDGNVDIICIKFNEDGDLTGVAAWGPDS